MVIIDIICFYLKEIAVGMKLSVSSSKEFKYGSNKVTEHKSAECAL